MRAVRCKSLIESSPLVALTDPETIVPDGVKRMKSGTRRTCHSIQLLVPKAARKE